MKSKRLKKAIFALKAEIKNTRDQFRVMILQDKLATLQDKLVAIPTRSKSSAGNRLKQSLRESDKAIFKTHWSPVS